MKNLKSENPETYQAVLVGGDDETYIIDLALSMLEKRLKKPGYALTSPQDTKNYLTLQFAGLEHEEFKCLFLDNRHKVIAFETLAKGTIDGASIYPREVLKAVLNHNAAAVIFAHNHPSGHTEPSRADEQITKRLTEALNLIDVRVLDHIIVGGLDTTSFAERGLI